MINLHIIYIYILHTVPLLSILLFWKQTKEYLSADGDSLP